jgi:glutathione S-transferase
MKLIFANRNYSSWSMRAWLVLRHFGIAFQEELVLLSGDGWREALRAKSPSGRVPVLVDGDLVIPETLAIIEYLAETFADKAIWPRDKADRALARAASSEMHAGFAALRNLAPMNLRASHPGKVDADLVADDLRRIGALWAELLDHSGGPYLFGDFSAADAMYAPVATRIRTYDLPATDHAQRYVEAIYALPAFQEWYVAAAAEPWVVEDDEIDVMRARAAGR